ncbi:MAG: histidinol-phosphate transaminase [bacterium]
MDPVNEHIRALQAYQPGLQPAQGEKVIKLNTNENPYPPPPAVLEAIRAESMDSLRLYPDPKSRSLRAAAAAVYGVEPEQVLAGNGSDEILGILLRTFAARGDRIGFYEPSYSYYKTLGAIHNLELVPTPVADDPGQLRLPDSKDLKVFFLTNPNSPLGFSVRPEFVVRLAGHVRGIVVVDEAYADFARWNCLPLIRSIPNVLVTRSLSKSYSLAGLRVGLAVGAHRWIEQMDKVRDHYNLSRIAQAAACVALREQDYLQENISRILKTRERLRREIGELGLRCLQSDANFLFVRFPSSEAASGAYRFLLERGVLVRYFPQEPLHDGLRISIGTERETDRLIAELKGTLES